ncbi:fibronectin type III domain-containing protein [Geomonas agri]|uniref:fibronectin type III domain-containing protein n=1 Tax=Geomonas agri TaxID=2873702 RepID=UPI001CD2E999|nr:fibronectin type III domain-containing protein [Geomonas agri]
MPELFDIPSLKDLSDGDLALHGENIAENLEEHPAFKFQTLPPCIPGPSQIRQDATLVKQTSTAARLDPSKEPERQAARDKMIQSIRFSCQYVVMYATHENDPSHLDTVGVPRAHRAVRNTTAKLPEKFSKVKVSHGDKSGAIKIYVNKWEGKGSVEVQICYGDPGSEGSWQLLKIAHYCHIAHEGLEPARRAYFRARLLNEAGVGPWSDAVELIII